MKDITKLVKSLKKFGLFIKSASETMKTKQKNKFVKQSSNNVCNNWHKTNDLVVTFSPQYNRKVLQQMKPRFKGTINFNKY